MNIFCTDSDPFVAASNLDDKRIIKMILESAQMLSTALHYSECDPVVLSGLYKAAYVNHPCTVWTRQSRGNFLWLALHGLAMCDLYRKIYGREHKTEDVLQKCLSLYNHIKDGDVQEFANCSLFKNSPDIVQSYRDTMNVKWAKDKHRPTWQGRPKPLWYENLG